MPKVGDKYIVTLNGGLGCYQTSVSHRVRGGTIFVVVEELTNRTGWVVDHGEGRCNWNAGWDGWYNTGIARKVCSKTPITELERS